MPTFELTGKDGGTYQVDAADEHAAVAAFSTFEGGAAPAAAPAIGENRASLLAALRGVPIAGAYADKAAAALNAAAQPLTETGLSNAPTFSDRLAENEQQLKAGTDAYEQSHPIGTTVGKMAIGTAAMVPAMALAPEAFGVTGATLAGRVAAGAASGGALGGADALARGEDVTKGAALGAALGGAGPVAGHVVGKAAQGVRNLVSPAAEIPSAEAIKDAASQGYEAVRNSGVSVKPESVQELARSIREDLRSEGGRDYLTPKTFGVIDELENGDAFTSPTGTPAHAQTVDEIRAKYGDAAANAYDRQQAAAVAPIAEQPNPKIAASPQPAAPKAQSLLEFIASKGGLGPDAELEAIGGHGHTVNVEGVGRRKLVRQGGWPLDYAREAAEEAGYLRGDHNGTSTVNDLLDAIDAEMRGQKRFPEGFEGHAGKREASALSERDQFEQDRHLRGLEDDLAAAGHGELGTDVKARAVDLMAREGLDPDTAVEHALLRLEQEDAAGPAHFPGDRPAPASAAVGSAGPKSAPSRIVTFSDLHGLRRALGKAAQSADGAERSTAMRAMNRLDHYLENIPESDVIGGNAKEAAAQLKEANANWTALKLSQRLKGKIDAAELQAASANSGANLDNALRQRVKDILKSPKQSQGFTQSEKLMMQRIVRGSAPANVIRALGNLLGGGGGLGALVTAGAGALAEGPIGVAAPLVGMAVKKIGNRMTEAQLARLDEMIRARAPHSEQARMAASALANARAARLARAQGGGAIAGRAVNPTVNGALIDDRRERRK